MEVDIPHPMVPRLSFLLHVTSVITTRETVIVEYGKARKKTVPKNQLMSSIENGVEFYVSKVEGNRFKR